MMIMTPGQQAELQGVLHHDEQAEDVLGPELQAGLLIRGHVGRQVSSQLNLSYFYFCREVTLSFHKYLPKSSLQFIS